VAIAVTVIGTGGAAVPAWLAVASYACSIGGIAAGGWGIVKGHLELNEAKKLISERDYYKTKSEIQSNLILALQKDSKTIEDIVADAEHKVFYEYAEKLYTENSGKMMVDGKPVPTYVRETMNQLKADGKFKLTEEQKDKVIKDYIAAQEATLKVLDSSYEDFQNQ